MDQNKHVLSCGFLKIDFNVDGIFVIDNRADSPEEICKKLSRKCGVVNGCR